MSAPDTDRIEKRIDLRAPRSRVWRALDDSAEFGAWFGVRMRAAFAPGTRVTGTITTPGYDHLTMEIEVERVEAERLFAYRWHPCAVDPGFDYSGEPTTLVEFLLEDLGGGTRLTLVESGFDRLPAARRATAIRMNEGGWAAQLLNIERHVATG